MGARVAGHNQEKRLADSLKKLIRSIELATSVLEKRYGALLDT